MADARLTQAAALAQGAGAADARLTQAAALVLVPFTAAEARATQAAALAVIDFTLEARLTQLAALALAEATPCGTVWAQCWRIERLDGAVIARTDHDVGVEFRGETYEPCGSLSASAAELAAMLGQVGNQELSGIIDDEGIAEEDLFGGLYDGALVEVWMVPWQTDEGEIPWRLTAGTIGKVTQAQLGFTAEVLTAAARLQQQPLLQFYLPSCRFRFGDSRCGIDTDALKVNGTVSGAIEAFALTQASRRSFADGSRTEEDGYFQYGTLTWTSGPNAGASSEIKSYRQSDGRFVLWSGMIHPIRPGHQYEAVPGCSLTVEACKFWENFINFGGFPDLPGQDSIIRSPNAKG